jgi:hypothetical protein
MAAGAVGASTTVEDEADTLEPKLGILFEPPGPLTIEPDLPGLPDAAPGVELDWAAAREALPLMGMLDGPTMLSKKGLPPRMDPWPEGAGNWVSLKFVEADSRLLWRSSKLTEGKKSKLPGAESFTPPWSPLRPKENKEWLFEDVALSIGGLASSDEVLAGVGAAADLLTGLMFSLVLKGGRQESVWILCTGPGVGLDCEVRSREEVEW